MKTYNCWTDGSCQKSKSGESIGGWASVIVDEYGNITKLFQGYKGTSNNRMEIMAVLETLKYFKEKSIINIVSDSMYVVNTINQGWARKWFEEKDFSKQNLDLWFELLDLLDFHTVKINWTKGHSNNEMNNLADELAQFAAKCLNLPKDEYYNNHKESCESLVSESNARGSEWFSIEQQNGKIAYSLGQQ